MQHAKSGLMPSATFPLCPSPGTSLGAMAIPCFQVPEESSALPCMGLISDSPSSKCEDTLSNADRGWVEGRQGICQGECCPTQTEQSPRTALAKDLSSRGHALCPRDAGQCWQRCQVFPHHRGSMAEERAPFGGQHGRGSTSC